MKVLECMLTLVGGAVIGACAALLLAPCKGSEMRKRICDCVRKNCSSCCNEECCHQEEELTTR